MTTARTQNVSEFSYWLYACTRDDLKHWEFGNETLKNEDTGQQA